MEMARIGILKTGDRGGRRKHRKRREKNKKRFGAALEEALAQEALPVEPNAETPLEEAEEETPPDPVPGRLDIVI